jgi:tetratricopeptide (TPR) repeat protein
LGHETQDQYAEAEALYGRALWINEKALGPDHPHVAADLNNLAGPYSAQGKYAEAESILKGALLLLLDNLLGCLCCCGGIGDNKEE